MNQNLLRASSAARGFALLFVLFLVALIIIGASVAVLSFKAEGLREKETVMIWRGEQYQRAIGLYYRKFGHFPTSIDQLVKGTNGIRFLREAYKDPVNKADGSWRLIYVTPAGQLIGSVRYVTLQQMALEDRARITGISISQNQETFSQIGGGISPLTPPGTDQNGSDNSPGSASANAGGTSGTSGASQTGQNGQQQNPFSGVPQIAPVVPQGQTIQPQISESTGEVSGGFIVGVASKIGRPSLKVYKGGTTYRQWEFIYNPLEQVQTFSGGTIIGGAPVNGKLPGMPAPQPPQVPQQPQIPH